MEASLLSLSDVLKWIFHVMMLTAGIFVCHDGLDRFHSEDMHGRILAVLEVIAGVVFVCVIIVFKHF